MSKLGWDTGQCPASPPEFCFGKSEQNLCKSRYQSLVFSGLLKFYLLFLLFAKYFVTDCSSHEKLQGDTTDSELKFKNHITLLNLKAGKKVKRPMP